MVDRTLACRTFGKPAYYIPHVGDFFFPRNQLTIAQS